MSGPSEVDIERAIARAGRSNAPTGNPSGAVDLSPAAIAERQKLSGGGMTGRELAATARRVFDRAQQLVKTAQRRPAGKRRDKANMNADRALMTAATQIRLAERCPLDRGYLHALDMRVIQTVKEEVQRAFMEDAGALAVDTHRRLQDQRNRTRAEGATA